MTSPSENFVSHNRPGAGKGTKAQKTKRLCGAGKPQSRNDLRQSHHSRSHGERAGFFLFSLSSSTKSRSVILGCEQFHLLDSDFVQAREALGLAQSFADEDGIEIFQI